MRNKDHKLIALIGWLLASFYTVVAQDNIQMIIQPSKAQFGVSGKLILDICGGTNLRVGIATGLGTSIYRTNLTSVNVEYSWAVHGFGTDGLNSSSHLAIAPHIIQSFGSEQWSVKHGNQPLYYFTDLITPPLQNPFKHTSGVGCIWVRHFGRIRDWQRVAHLSFKIGVAQVAYYNDGGTLLEYWGDGEDRYFTGGGFLNLHLRDPAVINKFGLSFHKFTGYSCKAFELSHELFYSSVDYKDAYQHFYNKGFWSFSVGNTMYGDAFIRYNNPPYIREFQNFIHYSQGSPYHLNLEDSYVSFGIAPSYYRSF